MNHTHSHNSSSEVAHIHPCTEWALVSGCPAVWMNNYNLFYTIHGVAVFGIFISIGCCLVVITSIVRKYERGKNGFPERFPLYIAINDLLWGVSHFADHVELLVNHRYPGPWIVVTLSSLNMLFYGFQQVMYGCIALYTYLKIVRKITLKLGRWEWKLQLPVFLVIATGTGLMQYYGVLGISKYWLLHAENGPTYMIAVYFQLVTSITQTGCTIFANWAIKQQVAEMKRQIEGNKKPNTIVGQESLIANSYHKVATECLLTFVKIGIFLYLPLTLTLAWICVCVWLGYPMFTAERYVLPMNLMAVTFSNGGGFLNALGYFYNKRLKRERRKGSQDPTMSRALKITSANSSSQQKS